MQTTKQFHIFESIVMRLISAILFAGILGLLQDSRLYTSIETLNEYKTEQFVLIFLCFFLLLTAMEYFFYKKQKYYTDVSCFMIAVFMYGFCIACNTKNIYYISVVGIFAVFAFRYVFQRFEELGIAITFTKKQTLTFLCIAGSCVFLHLCSLVVLRVYVFKPVTFDFGIFVQMFYYLKKCLIPYTTCERFELLSHFCIHFSPIFYLILPVYALFPSPVTLVVVQLIAVLSGVIPLYLMCRKKTGNLVTLGICMTYLLYPCLRGGLFYDFHENKFLAPLVLWLLYFFESERFGKKKMIGIVTFSLLILMVKEDAPIYTACIGLFQLFYQTDKKDKLTGLCLSIFSVIYFFVVFHFMGIYGDAGGAITSFGRYSNLMVSEYDGVFGLVMNMLKNPAYVLGQLLTKEKLEFLLWIFLPLLFLPFRSKNIATYLLFLPMIVLNLLSNYTYQHNIYYQYTYASGTIMIYLAYLELARYKEKKANTIAVCMMVMSLLLSTASISDRAVYYHDYVTYGESIREIRSLLDEIPQEASVTASTCYVPVLAQRDVIYKYKDGTSEKADTDFIVLELDGSLGSANLVKAEEYMQNGYQLFGKIEEKIIVLEKKK